MYTVNWKMCSLVLTRISANDVSGETVVEKWQCLNASFQVLFIYQFVFSYIGPLRRWGNRLPAAVSIGLSAVTSATNEGSQADKRKADPTLERKDDEIQLTELGREMLFLAQAAWTLILITPLSAGEQEWPGHPTRQGGCPQTRWVLSSVGVNLVGWLGLGNGCELSNIQLPAGH